MDKICGVFPDKQFILYRFIDICICRKVKEEASQGRLSDTLHVDSSGLVTITTPNRLATVSVRAIPLPQGKTHIKHGLCGLNKQGCMLCHTCLKVKV